MEIITYLENPSEIQIPHFKHPIKVTIYIFSQFTVIVKTVNPNLNVISIIRLTYQYLIKYFYLHCKKLEIKNKLNAIFFLVLKI